MMDLSPSADQKDLSESAATFLKKQLSMSRVRELAADADGDAIDHETWMQCAELGWLALSLPDDMGGLGLGLPEEVMLFRELGRHLTPGPFRSSVTAVQVALRSGEHTLAGKIARGDRRVGLEVGDLAVDARVGDLLLAVHEHGAELFNVLATDPVAGVDPGSRLVRVTKRSLVLRVTDASILSRARVLAAAELLGIIEAVRDMSASYARTRIQFGQPIGSFQAVKHRCADMVIASYAATGQVYQAALLVDAAAPDADFHAAAAFLLAVNGTRTSTAANIQNHGGIGFTWELDAQLYLKRGFMVERLFGPLPSTYSAILGPARHDF